MKKKKKKYNIQTERVLPTPEFLKKHEVIEKQTKRAGEKRLYVTDQLWIDTYYKKDIINFEKNQETSEREPVKQEQELWRN